jgi:hypothetical protein
LLTKIFVTLSQEKGNDVLYTLSLGSLAASLNASGTSFSESTV